VSGCILRAVAVLIFIGRFKAGRLTFGIQVSPCVSRTTFCNGLAFEADPLRMSGQHVFADSRADEQGRSKALGTTERGG
jgi:hypothetical protein